MFRWLAKKRGVVVVAWKVRLNMNNGQRRLADLLAPKLGFNPSFEFVELTQLKIRLQFFEKLLTSIRYGLLLAHACDSGTP